MSRSLSFQDCSFELVDGVMEASSEKCIDNAAELWAQLHKCINWLQARGELRTSFKGVNYGSDESDDDDANPMGPTPEEKLWSAFWGAHQRFFKELCVATKVRRPERDRCLLDAANIVEDVGRAQRTPAGPGGRAADEARAPPEQVRRHRTVGHGRGARDGDARRVRRLVRRLRVRAARDAPALHPARVSAPRWPPKPSRCPSEMALVE